MDPDVTGASVGTENGYTALAAGEPLPMTQPSDTNHIQFHGGFLEDQSIHTTQGTDGDMGYFYRMGVRHYSPALNRFMQRDPLSYTRQPGASSPLSLNPYIYAMNQPLQMSDPSGYEAGLPDNSCPGCTKGHKGGHGPVQTPTGGGNGTDDDNRKCRVYFPEDCLEEPIFEICKTCCQYEDEPTWSREGCCTRNDLSIGNCTLKSIEECKCACCWIGDGNGENAPAPIASGGSFGGGDVFGPPHIGPGGDGGYPWWFGPAPFDPKNPVQIPELGIISMNHFKSGKMNANIFNPLSLQGITAYHYSTKPNMMLAAGLIAALGVGVLVGMLDAILAMICEILDKGGWCPDESKKCDSTFLLCLCEACRTPQSAAIITLGVGAILGLIIAIGNPIAGGIIFVGFGFLALGIGLITFGASLIGCLLRYI